MRAYPLSLSRTDDAGRGDADIAVELRDIVIETMSIGLCLIDTDHRVLLINRRYREIYNLAADAVTVGMPMREAIRRSVERGNYGNLDADTIWRERLKRMSEGTPYEARHRLADGRTLLVKGTPLGDGRWLVTCEDITDRARMERELRVQNERFDQAISHMSHGLCMFGSDERLIICNDQYLKMYDLDPEVIKPGVHHRALLDHWLSRGNAHNMTTEDFYRERSVLVRAGGIVTAFLRCKDGRVIAATSRPTPNGGWVTTHEEATERLRYEAMLREQNILFDAAISNMAEALCMYDAEHRLIVCNEKYLTFFNADASVVKPGVTLRQVFQHGVDKGVYPGFTVEDLLHRRLATLAKGVPSFYDQKMADGRTLEVCICPMPNGGWVGTFEDISERSRVEEERAAALAKLQEQNLLFDAALDNMAHGLCAYDEDMRVVVSNRRYREIYRLDPEHAEPGTHTLDMMRVSIARGVHGPGASAEAMFADFMRHFVESNEEVLRRRLADGRVISVRHSRMTNGGYVGTYEDITERENALEELQEQYRRFDVALNNMAHGLCLIGADLRIIVCNRRYIEMYGFSPEIVKPGASMRDVLAHSLALGNYQGYTVDSIYEGYLEQLKSGTTGYNRPLADGRVIRISRQPMAHGGWICIYEDITERHKAEQSIAHMARHDALTDLPNRVLFREKMAEGLARVEAQEDAVAVFCLDLDNFKTINDTLGHPIGDKLLRTITERVRGIVDERDTVARLGGDEFAILQCRADPQSADALARRLVEAISEPIVIDGHEIITGVSIGIALAPNDGTAADHLMKCADLALYRAKAEGRATYRFFEPDMGARIQARRALEIDLRRALGNGEFSLVYQPQVRLADNRIVALEALLRWNHPERGAVPPSEFIPLAEEMGLIVQLGEWVIREACAEAARWPGAIRIAVNLSPVQFRSRGLLATVTRALAAARMAPDRLELEITEAVVLQNDDSVVAMLHQMRALGVRIAMDDFGTGYSSLSYLRSFPFDKIKIDRSFISDIEHNRDCLAIIRAIASLGTSLGIDTTAEGVETEQQRELVRKVGCTEMQGYLVSRPRSAADVLELIADARRGAEAA